LSKFSGSEYNTELEVAITELMNSLPLVTEINFNEIFNKFINLFQDIVNKHAPMNTLSRKQNNSTTNRALQRNYYCKSKKKGKMYKTHFLNGTDTDKKNYKIFANKLTKSKNVAKRIYFENKIQKCKANSRQTWELIKTLLPNKKVKQFSKKIRGGW